MRYMYENYVDGQNRRVDICISHFAGKAVRGTSKCVDTDLYCAEFGKALAQARCDERVTAKKVNRLTKVIEEREQQLAALSAEICRLKAKLTVNQREHEAAKDCIQALLLGEAKQFDENS